MFEVASSTSKSFPRVSSCLENQASNEIGTVTPRISVKNIGHTHGATDVRSQQYKEKAH